VDEGTWDGRVVIGFLVGEKGRDTPPQFSQSLQRQWSQSQQCWGQQGELLQEYHFNIIIVLSIIINDKNG
jgi:hypothetical protein